MKRVVLAFVLFLSFLNSVYGTSLSSTLQLTKAVSKTIATQMHGSGINLQTSKGAKSHLKGDITEFLTNMEYFKRLNYSGTWAQVSPREGSQGLDHLYISFNKNNGLPDGCIIGESKYGASKLKLEKNGVVQMSEEWRSSRLKSVVDNYDDIEKEIADSNYAIQKPLPNVTITKYPISRKSYFYKYKGDSKWYYCDGGDVPVPNIYRQTNSVKEYLNGVKEGRIFSRNVVAHYSIDKKGDFIQSVYKYNDATKTEEFVFTNKLGNNSIRRVFEDNSAISEKIKETFGLSDSQMILLKKRASNKDIIDMLDYNPKEFSDVPRMVKKLKRRDFWGSYGEHTLITIAASTAFDTAIQFVRNDYSFNNFEKEELVKASARAIMISSVYEGKKLLTDVAIDRARKKLAQSAVVGILPIPPIIDAVFDYAAGYAIDTVIIQKQKAKGQISEVVANKKQQRAVLVNGIPSAIQIVLSLIPGGASAGPMANAVISVLVELFVPDYDELSIGVLYDEMQKDPNIIEKWIAERLLVSGENVQHGSVENVSHEPIELVAN